MKPGKIITGICMGMLSGLAFANDSAAEFVLPSASSLYSSNFRSLDYQPNILAANEGDAVPGQSGATSAMAVSETPAAEFKPPLMSGRKAHQYLGLGTVVLAGLTMLTAPEEGCDENCPPVAQQPPRQTSGTTHTRLARATAVMAVATVMTGLVFHWNDIHWEDPFTDPDKMHARLATAGALLLLYAVDKSAKSPVPTSHAGTAELGAVAMLVAIKLTW